MVRASRKSFKPVRRKNGGFGHSTTKYSKNPAIQHNRDLEDNDRKRVPIKNPWDNVHDLLK